MKKKGSNIIEVIVAITIFTIAILPIIYLTANSLRALRRSSEIEERTRVSTSIINYIKSRGYNYITSSVSWNSNSVFSNEYFLAYDDIEKAFIVDNSFGGDFEEDFYNTSFYDPLNTTSDALFLLNSIGINLEGASFIVNMKQSDLFLINNSSNDEEYINPISNDTTSIFLGEDGVIEEKLIYGSVTINYASSFSPEVEEKSYTENFILVPIENFNN